MPTSTLSIATNKSIKQDFISEVKSGKYNNVSFLNIEEADDALLKALEESYLTIELPLAHSENYCGVELPTFTLTSVINQFDKKSKKRRINKLNFKRSSFSFSKFNASHLTNLSQCFTLQELNLRYYVCKHTADNIPLGYKKYNDEQFFHNLAQYITINKSLVQLKIDVYKFETDYKGNIDKKFGKDTFGLPAYFPYEKYSERHAPFSHVDLTEQTILSLLKAFITNYSLLEVDTCGWVAGVFHKVYDINEWLAKGNLTTLLRKSLQEFKIRDEVQTCNDFFNAVLKRNQMAAAQLRRAATNGKENNVKVVEKLLEKGVSVFSADENGNTALHLAAEQGYVEIVQILKKHGADWRAPNKKGQTPVSLAQDNHRYGVIGVLTGKSIEAKYTDRPVAKAAPLRAAFTDRITDIGIPPQTQIATTTAYPVMSSVNVVPKSNAAQLEKMPTKKMCPLTKIFGLFNSSNKSIKSSYTEAVKPIMAAFPKISTTAKEIANAAITGAINGLAAVPGCDPNNAFDPYNSLQGLGYNITFASSDERELLVNLIIQQLLVAPVFLNSSVPNSMQEQCLVGCLARQIRFGNLIIFDDESPNVARIVNNKNIKMHEKVQQLQNAICYALNDAENKTYLSSIPSAPPLENEQQATSIIQQPILNDAENKTYLSFIPSAPPLEDEQQTTSVVQQPVMPANSLAMFIN